ncbi:hypothetical protein BsWGS_25245 [Bradybaena similaris]
MPYPTLSPCAMAPILHAASRRRANLTSATDNPESSLRSVGYSELREAESGRPVKSTIELQPVKVVFNKSDPPANALSRKTSALEPCSQDKLSYSSVRNSGHLMQSSPPTNVNGCITIDHNGNNKNWNPRNTQNVCSLGYQWDDCRCNTCKHKRGMPYLWINTSLATTVTDDDDQGDLLGTIFLTNETDLGEMEKAHQDVNIFAAHEEDNEDGLIETGFSNVQEPWLPEGKISKLQNQKLSSGAGELSEGLPAAAETYSRDSGQICRASSTAVSCASMTPEYLSDTDIQPQGDQPPGLVEIGRCSIYLDTETGEYHSVVDRSFPRRGHSMFNTLKKESIHHRSISHSSGHPSFTNSEASIPCSSQSMPTQFSSFRNRKTESNGYNFTLSKEGCVDGSVDDCGQCVQCQHAFQDCVSAHLTEFCRQLSAPNRQSMAWDLDTDQLVQTYPGAAVCESEDKSRPHTGASSCQSPGGKNLPCYADKKGAVCLRCCAPMPSSFEPDGNPMTIHAIASPTYSPFTASCTQVDDHADVSEKDTHLYESKCPDTKDSFSKSYDDKGQPRLKSSTKWNKLTSSLSSFFESLSGKSQDESQKNGNNFHGSQQHLNIGSSYGSRPRAVSAPGDQHSTADIDLVEQTAAVCYRPCSPQHSTADRDLVEQTSAICYRPCSPQHSTAGRDLAEQTAAICYRSCSPQHINGHLCEINNSSSGSGQQIYTWVNVNPEDSEDNRVQDSDANKDILRIFRQLNRCFVAYLCCPQDALSTFGLPFHKLLESWGLPILIPERDLPVSGIKYQNMAECIEERCNGKIIVILSNTYANSDECLFLTYFAKTLDPDSRHRNIIPVLIDSNPEVPSVLRGLSFIKYNHLVRSGWLKEKLVKAIAA